MVRSLVAAALIAGALCATTARAQELTHVGVGLMIDYMPPLSPGLAPPLPLLTPPGFADRTWGLLIDDTLGVYFASDYRLISLAMFGALYAADVAVDALPDGTLSNWVLATLPITPLVGGTAGILYPFGPIALGGGIGGEFGFVRGNEYVDDGTGAPAAPGPERLLLSAGPTGELCATFVADEVLAVWLRTNLTPSWAFDVVSFAAVKSYTELKAAVVIEEAASFYALVGFQYAAPMSQAPSTPAEGPPLYVPANYALFRLAIGADLDVISLL